MDITEKTYDEIAEAYTKNWSRMTVTKNFRKKFIRYVKKGKIIDVGCGSGVDAQYFSRKFDVVGIDVSKNMIKIAKSKYPKIKFLKSDMRKMRFRENSFDGAWISQSAHHISKKNLRSALRKMKRVLKKDGIILLSVREGEFEGYTVKSKNKIFSGKKRFLAMYREDELLDILRSLNYEVIEATKKTRKLGEEVYINVFAKNIKHGPVA